MLRIARIIINSFALVLLVILAYIMWQSNPLLSLLLALAAVDQFEDVYYYTYRRRLFPSWFMPIDMVLEAVLFLVALGMLVLSLMYYVYFETWFFRALIPLSAVIMYSALEDIAAWRHPPPELNPKAVMHYVCPKEEVCEEKRFVRRKQQLGYTYNQ